MRTRHRKIRHKHLAMHRYAANLQADPLRPQPAMSVVLATPDCYATIRHTISYLRAQTVASQLELVIVCSSTAELHADTNELTVFSRFCIVEVGPLRSSAQANAAGARAATAPVVAFGEDHCFPQAQWAEILLKRHQDEWAVVGPSMANANPENSISLADLYIAYAPWVFPGNSHEVKHAPGHNSSYKRQALLYYEDRLEEMLEAEYLMHCDMHARGLRLYHESEAVASHTNYSMLKPFTRFHFHNGRSFATARARHWNASRRVVYALASPMIPMVRLQRISRQVIHCGVSPLQLLYAAPAMLLGLVMNGLGEGVGYCTGIGNSQECVLESEFHRYRYTVSGRKARVQSEPERTPLPAG